jgi:hypothetical protein
MKVRVSDPKRLRELVSHLESRGCEVSPVDEATVEVTLEVPLEEAARLELDLYLRVWEVSSDTRAERVE